jgi:chromate reductase
MLILGISGSLRRGSYNRMLLKAVARRLPPDVGFALLDDLEALPLYNEELDVRPAPASVCRLRGALATADAVLVATPEYNGGIPGALKNALDWASRPFPDNCLRGKPTAVVGASTGMLGAVAAQAELRRVLVTIGARPVAADLSVPSAHQAFTDDGRLREPTLVAAVEVVVAAFVGQLSEQAA